MDDIDFIKRNLPFDNDKKNSSITKRIAVVCIFAHLLYGGIFFYLHSPIIFVYNLLSICFYILVLTLHNKNIILTYRLGIIEATLFSVLAVSMLGWQYGFQNILWAIIFICYMIYVDFKWNPDIIAIFISLIYVSLYVFSAIYHDTGGIQSFESHLIFILNFVSALVVVVASAKVLDVTTVIRHHYDILEKENISLKRLVDYDELTGLMNRRAGWILLDEKYQNMITNGIPIAIGFGDIDDFKIINDTLGHDCGDIVLKEVGKTLSEILETTAEVIRWGGEEFLIVFHIFREEDIIEQLENCRKKIERKIFNCKGTKFRCTLTFGCAITETVMDISHVIANADKLMYIGKSSGKNKVVVKSVI